MDIADILHAAGLSQAVYVAARLGIADVLAGGPMTSARVAAAAGADPDAMHRLLRALATLNICEEDASGTFTLTTLGSHLRADAPDSVRSYALHWGGSMWPAWSGLLHSVKTGRNPRDLVSRSGAFERLSARPDAAKHFNDAMSEISRLVARSVVSACDFSDASRVADVGGGQGFLLGAILAAWPTLNGVLFDRADVLAGAGEQLERAGVLDRCDLVAGSFFDGVPAGADVYTMKSVLHDWDDDRAATILVNCRSAMNDRGRLVIVERVLPDRAQALDAHRFACASDLAMMVAVSGRERTEAAFRALLTATGFELTRIEPVAAHYSVIEALRA